MKGSPKRPLTSEMGLDEGLLYPRLAGRGTDVTGRAGYSRLAPHLTQ